MSRFVRASKVRHVYCQPAKHDKCYQTLQLCTATGDHNYIKGNTKFFAVPYRGVGSLAVIPYTQMGKQKPSFPMICGHKGKVLDFDFNPFHEHIIASTSEDCTVKVWGIPEEGITENITEPLVNLVGHQRKTTHAEFHPTAEHVLATTSADYLVKIWDIEKGEEKSTIDTGSGVLIQDSKWSYTGATLALSAKDKMLRLCDPRSGEISASVKAHEGAKAFKLAWLGAKEKLVSVGFTRQSKRQIRIWDPKNMAKEICTIDIDQAAGVIMPFYDPGSNLLFLAGKGDGNVRYFEMVDAKPWAFSISEYRSSTSAKGMAFVPKRSVNVMGCEIARLLKLTSNTVEPLSFIIPRKSEMFQADIFPDCYAGVPATTADEFFAGAAKPPPLMSLDPSKNGGGGAAKKSGGGLKKLKSAAVLGRELAAANATIATQAARIKELEAQLAK